MKDKKIVLIVIGSIFLLVMFLIMVISSMKDLSQKSHLTPNQKVGFTTPEREEEETKENTNVIIEEEDIYTNSIVIKQLVNNSWNRISAGFTSNYELLETGKYSFAGYTLNSSDNLHVNSIIFNKEYTEPVIGHLLVGTSYEEALKKLEEPTFYNKRFNLYGYKTGNFYAFFSDDEVAIYPKRKVNNSEFEKLLLRYLNGMFDGNQTNFVVELRRICPDFDAKLDGENVILISTDRQVKITLNGNYLETEVVFYNGFEGSDLEYNKDLKITEEREKDLVELIELERISVK